jgi:predicted RND superfamily exporter protein
MTSSAMLIFALAAIGIFVTSAIISEVCITLAIGVLVAVILILFILPGMVACCDRLLGKRKETQIK